MSTPEAPEAGIVLVELPSPPPERRAEIARFLVEQFSRRALMELGLLPDNAPDVPGSTR